MHYAHMYTYIHVMQTNACNDWILIYIKYRISRNTFIWSLHYTQCCVLFQMNPIDIDSHALLENAFANQQVAIIITYINWFGL